VVVDPSDGPNADYLSVVILSLSGEKRTLTGYGVCVAIDPTRTLATFIDAQRMAHSITSSALTRSVFGTTNPNAFAVLLLIDSSNLVGACTGRLPGDAPFKIRLM
jgi:hypothetical protein